MPDPTIIGPQDAQLLLQASVTKTSSFNSVSVDLGAGFAPAGGGKPVQAVVTYSAADFTTGDETYSFKLQDSADNSSFTDRSAAVAASVSAAAPSGSVVVGGFLQQRYVRLVATLGGTTPSITYAAYLQPNTLA